MVAPGPCARPVLQFLGGLVVTIFLDIVHISIFYPRASLSDTERFSAGMAIVSTLLKPVSCCFIYQMHRERGGEHLLHAGEASASAPPASSPTPLSLAQVLACCHLPTSPWSPPCPPPSPGPREPSLPPERRARGAGRGLAWALGARLDRVQVSGLCCRSPGVPLAAPTCYDLSLAPGYSARFPCQPRHGCSFGRDPVPQAVLGSLWPEACRHLQGQLPLSAPSSPIAGTPVSCRIRGLGGQGSGGAEA